MKRINFGTVFQIIQILAIGYLVFKVLQPTSTSKKLDAIEKHQQELNQAFNMIIADHKKTQHIYDSIDRIRLRKIDSVQTGISTSISQMRAANKKIDGWRTIFEENKVVLPDPDK